MRRLFFLCRPFLSSKFFRLALKSPVLQADSTHPILQKKKQSKKFLLRFFLLLAEPLPQLGIGAFRKNKIDDVLLGHDFLNQLIIQRMQQINETDLRLLPDTLQKICGPDLSFPLIFWIPLSKRLREKPGDGLFKILLPAPGVALPQRKRYRISVVDLREKISVLRGRRIAAQNAGHTIAGQHHPLTEGTPGNDKINGFACQ